MRSQKLYYPLLLLCAGFALLTLPSNRSAVFAQSDIGLSQTFESIDFAKQRYLTIEEVKIHYYVFPARTLVSQSATIFNDDCDPITIKIAPGGAEVLVNGQVLLGNSIVLPDRSSTALVFRFANDGGFTGGAKADPGSQGSQSSRAQVAEAPIIDQVLLLAELMDSLDLDDIAQLNTFRVPMPESGSQLMYSDEGKLFMKRMEAVPLDALPRLDFELSTSNSSPSVNKTPIDLDASLSAIPAMSTKNLSYRIVEFDEKGQVVTVLATSTTMWQIFIAGFLAVLFCIWIGWLLLRKVFG